MEESEKKEEKKINIEGLTEKESEALQIIAKVIEHDRNLSEFFVNSITQRVESKMEGRMQSRLMFARVGLVILLVIIGPAAWFGIQNAINIGVTEKIDAANKENVEMLNDKLEAAINDFDEKIKVTTDERIQSLKDELQYKTLLLDIISSIIYAQVDDEYIEEDINLMMNNFKEARKYPILLQRPTFPILIDKAVQALIKYGHNRKLKQLESWYPDTINNMPSTTNQLLKFYGLSLMGSIYAPERWDSYEKAQFENYLEIAKVEDDFQAYLPLKVLYEFRLSNQKENAVVDALIREIASLPADNKVSILRQFVTYSDARFWNPGSVEQGTRVAALTNTFLQTYGKQLKEIASTPSVKAILSEEIQSSDNKAYADKLQEVYF